MILVNSITMVCGRRVNPPLKMAWYPLYAAVASCFAARVIVYIVWITPLLTIPMTMNPVPISCAPYEQLIGLRRSPLAYPMVGVAVPPRLVILPLNVSRR